MDEKSWETWWTKVKNQGTKEIAIVLALASTLEWQMSQFWLEVALFPSAIPKQMVVYKLQAMATAMRRAALPEEPWMRLEKAIASLLKKNDPEIRWVLDQLQHVRPNRGLSWIGEFWSNDELHAHVGAKMPDMRQDHCSKALMMMKHFPMDFRDGFRGGQEVSEEARKEILRSLSDRQSEDEYSTGGTLNDSREEDCGSPERSPVPRSPMPKSPPKVKEPEKKRQKKDKFRVAPEYAAKSKTALFNRESLKGIPEGVRKQLGRWTFSK